jgi:hypothetical protein
MLLGIFCIPNVLFLDSFVTVCGSQFQYWRARRNKFCGHDYTSYCNVLCVEKQDSNGDMARLANTWEFLLTVSANVSGVDIDAGPTDGFVCDQRAQTALDGQLRQLMPIDELIAV